MNTLMTAARQFARDEEGITAIEYGLIAALMAAALGIAVGYITGALEGSFNKIGLKINPTP
jgi:pilus assembly protein Flp/PilA